MAAAGRWLGVILSDRGPDRPPLRDSERYLLWTLGKTAALAAFARLATNKQAQARQLQERMDLAREVHESVIQRLFGIQLVFSSQAELSPAARERIGAELQAALFDLRRALQRPLGRAAPETAHDAAARRSSGCAREHRDLHLDAAARLRARRTSRTSSSRSPSRCSPRPSATRTSTPGPTRVEVCLERQGRRHARARRGQRRRARARPASSGMGLKLAALEALQLGGIVEFGEREPGSWRVRLAVPLDRT